MNIARVISQQTKQKPYEKAIIFPGKKDSNGAQLYSHLTYRSLEHRSQFFAQELSRLGIKKGSKVLLFVRPSLEFPIIAFALFKVGAIPIFIDPGMSKKNLYLSLKSLSVDGFIGVFEAQILRLLCPQAFKSTQVFINVDGIKLWNTHHLRDLFSAYSEFKQYPFKTVVLEGSDPAAILFTSGATGKPKGVVYNHQAFHSQIDLLQNIFQYESNDRDMPGFPLFSLLTIAMGVTSIVPEMDPSRPATANPQKLVKQILDQGVTTACGSPAIWEKVADYCLENHIQLEPLRAVIMFGAPVDPLIHEKFTSVLPSGTTYAPYGATECLPLTLVSGKEMLQEGKQKLYKGLGSLVGKSVPKTDIQVIKTTDQILNHIREVKACKPYEIGEIIVQGAQASKFYLANQTATKKAKITDDNPNFFWHRMGDLGYFDDQGRIFFCGRKSHSFVASGKNFHSIPCEGVINQHPDVKKSALICLKSKDTNQAGMVILRKDRRKVLSEDENQSFKSALLKLAQSNKLTEDIKDFFLLSEFPVDTRHNIKINRPALSKLFSKNRKSML